VGKDEWPPRAECGGGRSDGRFRGVSEMSATLSTRHGLARGWPFKPQPTTVTHFDAPIASLSPSDEGDFCSGPGDRPAGWASPSGRQWGRALGGGFLRRTSHGHAYTGVTIVCRPPSSTALCMIHIHRPRSGDDVGAKRAAAATAASRRQHQHLKMTIRQSSDARSGGFHHRVSLGE